MKKLNIILITLILLSCNEPKKGSIQNDLPCEIFVEVQYKDNSIDTISRVYHHVGDEFIEGRPRVRLTDDGCLQMGYNGPFFESMPNVACDVKTFKPLYLVTKNNDTIR